MLRQTTRTIINSTRPVERIICPSVFVGGQRLYHKSAAVENELIVGGLVAAGGAITLQYAIAAYRNYQASRPPPKPEDEAKEAKATKTEATEAPKAKKASAGATGSTSSNPNSSPFATWFARNFYDGGFEEKMSKREAALILGIRESASVERVKEAHRRILLLNHPDRGGSAHIAAKINEAKDLLLKGKQ